MDTCFLSHWEDVRGYPQLKTYVNHSRVYLLNNGISSPHNVLDLWTVKDKSAKFEVLNQYVPGGIEENHINTTEIWTWAFRIQSRVDIHLTVMSSHSLQMCDQFCDRTSCQRNRKNWQSIRSWFNSFFLLHLFHHAVLDGDFFFSYIISKTIHPLELIYRTPVLHLYWTMWWETKLAIRKTETFISVIPGVRLNYLLLSSFMSVFNPLHTSSM
jgi:hypothetical protein